MKTTEITVQFVDALNNKFKGKQTILGPIEFKAVAGLKFDRIICPKRVGSSDSFESSAHAFIERKTGKLYRAVSWDVPAGDARYDLTDKVEFMQAVELSDPYGNYLHRNYARKTYAQI